MNILTIDFETYYSKDFSLSKMTTEEYIRHDDFEIIGVAVADGSNTPVWFSGTHQEVCKWFRQFDWENSFVLAHNTQFDGAILSWKFGIKPKGWLDTLCMARAVHGVDAGGSLKALAERYKIGVKGDEVVNALGKRRADFSVEGLSVYGDYCCNDVSITRDLFDCLVEGFPVKELKVIDCTLRMFVEPRLVLNAPMLKQHLENVKAKKEKLLEAAATDKEVLLSNDKFADVLMSLSVEPPRKTSPRTGKETWAFAKTDEGFKALAEHPDPRVQALVCARLGTKTTLEETRTQRFIDIAERGPLPVPIKYYAAHTGRWGGDDKINLQNLPSRGNNAGKLKMAIEAPPGYVIIDADSSQIEARTVAWLAGQNDLVDAFAKGEDVYKTMASAIYNKPAEEITKEERFVGKTCIAEGTPVLCKSGWKRIETVTTHDLMWDGEEWVCHQGLLNNGIKPTLNLCGIWLTPDHQVWSGANWLEAQLVAADENILSQALGTGAANLPSQAMFVAKDLGLAQSSSNAPVTNPNTRSISKTSRIFGVLAALFAPKKHLYQNDTGATLKFYPTMHTARGYLTGLLLPLPAATPLAASTTNTTESVGSVFMKVGVWIEQLSSSTYKQLTGGIASITRWIGLMSTATTNPATSGLYQDRPTYKTKERLLISKPVYDILNCGLRNRFTILTNSGPLIVHNCILGAGYGMGATKFQAQLKTFGVEIEEAEAKRIIDVYRSTYSRIPALWKQGNTCIEAMLTNNAAGYGVVDAVQFDPRKKGFRLPSGLWQKYEGIRRNTTPDNKEEFVYDTRKGAVKIYGGKLTENICQAVARCVIAEQMLKISKKYKVVLTVHDAIACIAPEEEVEEAQKYVEECMRWRPDWAQTLPLNCESGVGRSYGEC